MTAFLSCRLSDKNGKLLQWIECAYFHVYSYAELIGHDAADGLLCLLGLHFDPKDESSSSATSVNFLKISRLYVPADSIHLPIMVT
jgi:hypothetical protein